MLAFNPTTGRPGFGRKATQIAIHESGWPKKLTHFKIPTENLPRKSRHFHLTAGGVYGTSQSKESASLQPGVQAPGGETESAGGRRGPGGGRRLGYSSLHAVAVAQRNARRQSSGVAWGSLCEATESAGAQAPAGA